MLGLVDNFSNKWLALIPMGTNCAPLLVDLFFYSYDNEILDKLVKEGKRNLPRKFYHIVTLMTLSL